MKILVTGGCGFVGSYLTRRLLQEGYEVTVLDSLARNRDWGLKVFGELHEAYPNTFKFVRGDIRFESDVRRALAGQEAVFHLAAVINVRASVDRPLETMDVNLGGTLQLLQACREFAVKKLVFASSLSVYGNPYYLPYDEDHPTNPLSPYAVSKLAGEHLVRMYGELYGFDTVNLRFSNIYGTGGSGVISVFLNRIRDGKPITVYGGSQVDDFVHVSDAVNAYMRSLSYKHQHGTFNVGSGETTSINGLVQSLKALLKSDFAVEYAPPKSGEITDSRLDFTRARQLLGYSPSVTLQEGIQKYIEAQSRK